MYINLALKKRHNKKNLFYIWLFSEEQHKKTQLSISNIKKPRLFAELPRGKSGNRDTDLPPPPPTCLPPFHSSAFLNVEEEAINALKATIKADN